MGVLCFFAITLTSSAHAITQEDVFKSIHENVDQQSGDSRLLVLFGCVAGGTIILLVLFNQRRQREAAPQAFLHHGRLVKEVARRVSLKPAELKQLRILAEAAAHTDAGPVNNPLTLLLCPSVLGKSLQARSTKVDRRVVARFVRKIK